MKRPNKKTYYLTVSLGLALCAAQPALASFDVNLLGGQFSSYVFVATNSGWENGLTGTTTAPVPCSDALEFAQTTTEPPGRSCNLGAAANASLFNVLVNTYYTGIGYFPAQNATARAESTLWFSPLTSGTATLELEHLGAKEWFHSKGKATLFDVTANQTVWNHDWSFGFISGATRTDNPDLSVTYNYAVNTELDSSHVYSLFLQEQSWADADQQFVSLQLSGLTVASVIPEPSSLALITLGFGVLLNSKFIRKPARR